MALDDAVELRAPVDAVRGKYRIANDRYATDAFLPYAMPYSSATFFQSGAKSLQFLMAMRMNLKVLASTASLGLAAIFVDPGTQYDG